MIHKLKSNKNYRIFRFLQKGFSIASTVSVAFTHEWFVHHFCQCDCSSSKSCKCVLTADQLMRYCRSDPMDCQKIDKHWMPKETDSNADVFENLKQRYGYFRVFASLNDVRSNCFHFDPLGEPDYIEPPPKVVDISDAQGIRLHESSKRNKRFMIVHWIRDARDNFIKFLLRNVVVKPFTTPETETSYYYTFIDATTATQIMQCEHVAHDAFPEKNIFLFSKTFRMADKWTLKFKTDRQRIVGYASVSSKANILICVNDIYKFYSNMRDRDQVAIQFFAEKLVWL